MRTQLSSYLDNSITFLIFLIVTLLPIFFLPITTNQLETPKLYLLIGLMLLILPLKALQWLVLGRIYLVLTPLDIPLFILLIGLYLSTLFSSAKITSFLGNLPNLHGGLISWTIYILFYLTLVNHIRTRNKYNFLILGVILGVFLANLGYLSARFYPNMSVISDPFLLSILITLTAPILVNLIVKSSGLLTPIFSSLALSLNVAVFLLTQNWLVLIPLVITLIILMFVSPPKLDALPKLSTLKIQLLTLPVVVGLITLSLNFSQTLPTTLPEHIQLKDGIKETLLSLEHGLFLGNGLSTSFFNTETKLSYPMRLFIETKLLGTIPLLLLTLISLRLLLNKGSQKEPLDQGLTLSALTTLFVWYIYPTSLVVLTFLLSLIALKIVQFKSPSTLLYSLPLRQLLFLGLLLFSIFTLFQGRKLVLADYLNHQALQFSEKPQEAYALLNQASNLVPLSDLYHANLSLSSYLYAQSIAEIYQNSPASNTSAIRTRDEELIKSLLDESLIHAQRSTEINPVSHQNYLLLGFTHQRAAKIKPESANLGYQAFLQTLKLNPESKDLPFQIASWYYSLGEYNLAAEFFRKAVSVDPNWANAHYNLALTYKELGQGESVKEEISTVLKLLSPLSPDYQAAEQVLSQKEATESASLNLPSQDRQKILILNGRKI